MAGGEELAVHISCIPSKKRHVRDTDKTDLHSVTALTQFPVLTSIRECLLWFSEYSHQHYDGTQLEFAQNLFKVLPDRLQHARPREFTVVIFLGLRTVAHILGGDSKRWLALNPYVAFYGLIRHSPSFDKDDSIYSSKLTKLRQLEDVKLERKAPNGANCWFEGLNRSKMKLS